MRLLGILGFLLVTISQVPSGALGAEVVLRNALGTPNRGLNSASSEDPNELRALVQLTLTLEQPTADLNHAVNGTASLLGNVKPTDVLAKNVPQEPTAPRYKQTEVIDHYETLSERVPVYKTIEIEDAGAGE